MMSPPICFEAIEEALSTYLGLTLAPAGHAGSSSIKTDGSFLPRLQITSLLRLRKLAGPSNVLKTGGAPPASRFEKRLRTRISPAKTSLALASPVKCTGQFFSTKKETS